jgi:hypothetical protein
MVTILTCIPEVHSSFLARDTDYIEWGFCCLEKWQEIALKYKMASFSAVPVHFTTIRNYRPGTSLNKLKKRKEKTNALRYVTQGLNHPRECHGYMSISREQFCSFLFILPCWCWRRGITCLFKEYGFDFKIHTKPMIIHFTRYRQLYIKERCTRGPHSEDKQERYLPAVTPLNSYK